MATHSGGKKLLNVGNNVSGVNSIDAVAVSLLITLNKYSTIELKMF